jgi:hypothetical protein
LIRRRRVGRQQQALVPALANLYNIVSWSAVDKKRQRAMAPGPCNAYSFLTITRFILLDKELIMHYHYAYAARLVPFCFANPALLSVLGVTAAILAIGFFATRGHETAK